MKKLIIMDNGNIFFEQQPKVIYAPKNEANSGEQAKFKLGNQWIKLDNVAANGDYIHEGSHTALAEVVSSGIAIMSNFTNPCPVEYHAQQVQMNNISYVACRSSDFLHDGETIITADDMAQKINEKNGNRMDMPEQLYELTDMEKVCNFKEYYNKMVLFDALVLNQDRHTNNIAFIRDVSGNIKNANLFDNGAAFLSDHSWYGLDAGVEENIKKAAPRLFWKSFDESVEYVRKTSNTTFKTAFCENDLENVFSTFETLYPEIVFDTVREIFEIQKQKYPEMFCSMKELIETQRIEEMV